MYKKKFKAAALPLGGGSSAGERGRWGWVGQECVATWVPCTRISGAMSVEAGRRIHAEKVTDDHHTVTQGLTSNVQLGSVALQQCVIGGFAHCLHSRAYHIIAFVPPYKYKVLIPCSDIQNVSIRNKHFPDNLSLSVAVI
ncbi:hypothetical protein BaRGS_00001647 [Batillaria attramentaria]|uniref:Uncharacterized protein n=1 Tax=Batillaria attramentaria TaxID=370345 RepID=A0ABD0M5U0_9CAEN